MRTRLAQLYKSIAGTVEYSVRGLSRNSNDCVVLCLHSTPHKYLEQLEQLLLWLKNHYTIIGPEEFDQYGRGELTAGPYLMLTFDDGIRNNFEAAKLLHLQGISAYFFIVPSFLQSCDQKAYYLRHIRPIVDPSFENSQIDFEALNVKEIEKILAMGHRIGCHSMSHDLEASMDAAATHYEIIDSKQWLESQFRIPVHAFCSPNNTNFSMNGTAKRLVNAHYQYHFTTFPGVQKSPFDGQLIFRRNIELNWPKGRIKYALGDWDLKRWHHAIQHYRDLPANY